MAENLVINGVTYPAVESIEVENTDGDTVEYKSVVTETWQFTMEDGSVIEKEVNIL